MTLTRKNLLLRKNGGDQDPHRVASTVQKERELWSLINSQRVIKSRENNYENEVHF
jgi:hypothetical protein